MFKSVVFWHQHKQVRQPDNLSCLLLAGPRLLPNCEVGSHYNKITIKSSALVPNTHVMIIILYRNCCW